MSDFLNKWCPIALIICLCFLASFCVCEIVEDIKTLENETTDRNYKDVYYSSRAMNYYLVTQHTDLNIDWIGGYAIEYKINDTLYRIVCNSSIYSSCCKEGEIYREKYSNEYQWINIINEFGDCDYNKISGTELENLSENKSAIVNETDLEENRVCIKWNNLFIYNVTTIYLGANDEITKINHTISVFENETYTLKTFIHLQKEDGFADLSSCVDSVEVQLIKNESVCVEYYANWEG